ncbi:MAG: CYTH domain-containing protein [Bacilli bacterium]|nr:CYTH domain-containing protein [Bacilli bacterium]
MSNNIEIEAKYLVGKKDYDLLLKYFNIKQEDIKEQTNYYFDTSNLDIIYKYRSALRIRKYASGEYELTLKSPHQKGIMELNVPISITELKQLKNHIIPDNSIKEILKNYNINGDNLFYIGKLKTKRSSIKYLAGEIFFDESIYFDKIDYEIEYESHSLEYGKKTLEELFNKLDIVEYKKSISKIKRLIKQIKDPSNH